MNDLNNPIYRIYNGILQGSVSFFTLALVYFAFVYYPGTVNRLKEGKIPFQSQIVTPVAANMNKLPIETANYKINFEETSGTYYVFIEGSSLNKYLLNKNGAQLALKSALSAVNLCSYNVIYVSTKNLDIPEKYSQDTNCR